MSAGSASTAQIPGIKRTGKKVDAVPATESSETHTIVFEWPLTGLKQLFESSKTDTKSKVVKSVPFGGGRWTVLFYAQSGIDQFCSLYLNAEPLPHERTDQIVAHSSLSKSGGSGGASGSSQTKTGGGDEAPWCRDGVFRFTFHIMTPDRTTVLGSKEAHDHAFSNKTSNWGWAQFAKRDIVYNNQANVKMTDSFIISVSITASPEKPNVTVPTNITVPPQLVTAIGSLLDDPDHSDVVFHIASDRRAQLRQARGRGAKVPFKKLFAIKKILAARSEYFSDMFESGFREARETSSSVDGSSRRGSVDSSPSHDHDGSPARNVSDSTAAVSRGVHVTAAEVDHDEDDINVDEVSELDDVDELFLDDSDEEMEEDYQSLRTSNAPRSESPYQAVNADGEDGPQHGLNDEYWIDDEVVRSRPLRAASQELAKQPLSSQGSDVGGRVSDVTGTASRALPPVGPRSLTSQAASSNNSPYAGPVRNDSIQALSPHGQRVQGGLIVTSAKRARANDPTNVKDGRKRRKVFVNDSAYPTFKALLYYLYTDTIFFAPLTSSFLPAEAVNTDFTSYDNSAADSFTEELLQARRRRAAAISAWMEANPTRPQPCSAKSIYKLADKLQLPELKKRAQEHIRKSLTVENIVWEAFSGFNAHYEEIRKMEVDFLLSRWQAVKRTMAMKTIFARSAAHPGLAEVWPHLLSQLEYKRSADEESSASDEEDATA